MKQRRVRLASQDCISQRQKYAMAELNYEVNANKKAGVEQTRQHNHTITSYHKTVSPCPSDIESDRLVTSYMTILRWMARCSGCFYYFVLKTCPLQRSLFCKLCSTVWLVCAQHAKCFERKSFTDAASTPIKSLDAHLISKSQCYLRVHQSGMQRFVLQSVYYDCLTGT